MVYYDCGVNGEHPFLGSSENCVGTRKGYTMNPDSLTPQPGAGSGATNVAPPGMEPVVKALKKEPSVDNPFAVAWAMYGQPR